MEIINPPPTHEELIQAAENKRQRLLSRADWRTELMLGETSDANRNKRSAWLKNKSEVKLVNIITIPDNIIWPAPPEG
ncbi:tail fiber assembly protein [Salmonella enterica]|uniref:Tail fiber assembly protein n=1 Tax=Salmonella enterica TaxID=28901 RepID=A0A5Y7W0E0_SALER|nr:phage tail protein [Salmonella enterica]EDW8122245.1 tail fiber assembly protein [Salmonella enterica subsp. salamae]EJU7775600.1 tail fiber assembly protein [Salmonella enterica subsp. arizonae serovar 6,7:g,z51:-]EAX3732252.1 tail fiber assembly protein [Salmonella enterica]EAZ8726737.1 tail fiber assembly protein [Salmonella enterica]